MIDDALTFWNAIKDKVLQTVRNETGDCLRCGIYEVLAAPSGNQVRIKKPYGNEILIKCPSEFSTLQPGDKILAAWYTTLSTAFILRKI